MIRITENDVFLFKYLFEERYLERSAIKNYIWKNRNNSYINLRLSQLKKMDYIDMKLHPLIKNAKLIFPNKKTKLLMEMKMYDMDKKIIRGNSILKYFNMEKYNIYTDFDKRRIKHDLLLTKTRLKLEDLGVDKWISYNMINNNKKDFPIINKEEFTVIPDGKFEYKGQNYFFEFDNHNRYKRYKKVTTVYKNNLVKNAIFIFNRKYIPDGFKKLLTVSDRNFYFGFYSDLNKKKVELENIIGEKLILGSDKN